MGINRREFMRRSGLVTAGTVALRSGNKIIWASSPAPAAVPSSDRLRVGVIGIGARAMQDATRLLPPTFMTAGTSRPRKR